MNTISSIKITDFQSHQKTILEPAPAGQLTCIVGPSDSGKTAVIRALRWLLYNTPQGADFIRVGSNSARVTIQYSDGQQVTRERSQKGFNRYEINGNRYEGFGSTVPLEVQEITGVRPVQIGDMEMCLNLAEQLDGPFLGKSVSAPAKAKVLGKLAGTEEVDYAAKGVGTDIYRGRQDEKRLADEVTRLQDELKKYDYLPQLAERITQVETLLANIKEAVERKLQLEKLRERWDENTKAQKTIRAQHYRLLHMIARVELRLSHAEQQLLQYHGLQDASIRLAATMAGLQQVISVLEATIGVNEAASILDRAINNEQKMGKLMALRGRHFLAGMNLPMQEHIIAITADIPEAEQVAAGLLEKVAKTELLRQSSIQRQLVHDSKVKAEKDIVRLAGLDLAAIVHYGHEENVRQLQDLSSLRLQLQDTKQRLEANETAVNQYTAEEERCSEAYKAALLAAGVCPVCGSRVSEQNLKEVV